jgi:Uma2 family endonuclease
MRLVAILRTTRREPRNAPFLAESARIVREDDGRIFHMPTNREATVDDLYRVDAKKAELVNGELVVMPLAGGLHGHATGQIFMSLSGYADRTKSGYAMPDGVGFLVNLPNRRSFCPDVSFTRGTLTRKFIDGAPIFAVEVRSDENYGPAGEREMAAKRADYFAAGTQVVWDVDVLRDHVVRVYRASGPESPTIYRRGDRAEAEPALPGWSMPVEDLFPRRSG